MSARWNCIAQNSLLLIISHQYVVKMRVGNVEELGLGLGLGIIELQVEMEQTDIHLLQLIEAKENSQLQEIKKQFSNYSKYFFNIRRNITIVYDRSTIYVIHKDYLKIIDLGKVHLITDLAYNYQRNLLAFLTSEGHLYIHFAATKTQLVVRKDVKRMFVMDWMYAAQQTANFFVAEQSGLRLYRVEQEKKSVKELKHISGKYHCFLFDPIGEFLAGLQFGECDLAYIFHLQPQRAKQWFRSGEVQVNFTSDETMAKRIRSKKCLGLQGSRIGKEVFFGRKNQPDDYFIDLQRLHGTPYLLFYYANEGKLQLTPLVEGDRKQVTIKLPSDSLPSLSVVDNMLVVHLRNEKITFIYDVNPDSFQALVSPYPLTHQLSQLTPQLYNSQFLGRRALLPGGHINKWRVSLGVIHHYLRNEMQVFEFLHRRANSKMETIRWLRQNLFTIKPISLSKMWKAIFSKIASGLFDESELVSAIQLYSNLFYTLSIEPLHDRNVLLAALIECLRQANEFRVPLPDEFQLLAVQLLLLTEKYELLAYLFHHEVFNPHQKTIRIIFEKGYQENNDQLLTLSIDLASQSQPAKEVLRLIMKSQRAREGKRFIRISYERMQPLDLLEAAKYLNQREVKREYISYARSLILTKYPSVNSAYLDEAESKLVE